VLSAIFAASEDAIIGMDPDGVITHWSSAAERLYGLSANVMLGRSISVIVPEPLYAAETRLRERVVRGERVPSYDTPRLCADGRQLLVSRTLAPTRDADGAVTGVAALERNVTQLRAVEAQLLQAKRMESVARLASGVAQEFNNIHTAILGLVEFVRDHVQHETARADLGEIEEQAKRGSGLARQLMGFSARQPNTDTPARANATIRAMEPLLHRLAGERIWLTADLSSSTTRVSADEAQLELILFELVINACESLGERGTITIDTDIREIAAEEPRDSPFPPGRYFEITVRHSAEPDGSSVVAKQLADPFFNDGLENPRFGFGLAMAYSVVQQLSGHVRMVANPQGESVVRVLLPVASDPASRDDPPAVDEHSTGDETILLVEDETPVREVVVRALRERGYRVLEAKNGEDALLVAETFAAPIHLVVTDVVMPTMDGRELFDKMRGWYPHIRFLFISGYTRGALSAEQLDADATGFLAKPFTMSALAVEMRKLLDGRRVLTPVAA
jgi:two-component system, cell cycle sensor histidine kinase and response regulator CckA